MSAAISVASIEQEIVTRKRFATLPWVAETDFHGSPSNRLTIRDLSELIRVDTPTAARLFIRSCVCMYQGTRLVNEAGLEKFN